MAVRALRLLAPAALVVALGAASVSAAPPAAPLGIVADPSGARLARLDPLSLRPLPGAAVALGAHTLGGSLSPDGARLVLGDGAGELQLVDVVARHSLGLVRLPAAGTTVATAWPRPRRVVAVERVSPSGLDVFSLDPATRRIVAETPLAGTVEAAGRTPTALVLLLGPAAATGPATLAVVDQAGAVRSAPLPGLRAGPAAVPGLAVDAGAGRAYAVSAAGLVAEVDLAALTVSVHPLAAPAVPARSAAVLPDGRLAVWGLGGVRLVDTGDWSVETLDPHASRLAPAGDALLAYGPGEGLSAYALDGTLRFHLFGRAAIDAVEVVGTRAFVRRSDGVAAVVDLGSGRVVRVFGRPLPTLLTAP